MPHQDDECSQADCRLLQQAESPLNNERGEVVGRPERRLRGRNHPAGQEVPQSGLRPDVWRHSNQTLLISLLKKSKYCERVFERAAAGCWFQMDGNGLNFLFKDQKET